MEKNPDFLIISKKPVYQQYLYVVVEHHCTFLGDSFHAVKRIEPLEVILVNQWLAKGQVSNSMCHVEIR